MVKLLAVDENTRIAAILQKLSEHYPQAKTSLLYMNHFQLFVATVLSAQTTDEQVNKITKRLFSAVSSVYVMSRMKPSELEPYLKSCGLFSNKSRFLVEASKIIVNQYDGQVPDDFEKLIKLPGVGRKTASVIIGSAFGKPALAVDTHVFRVSRRLGLAEGETVLIVEKQLKDLMPMEEWNNIHHRLIAHGRSICHARKPLCNSCFLSSLCPHPRKRGDL